MASFDDGTRARVPSTPTLTADGKAWAEANLAHSMLARVALAALGPDGQTWPEPHYALAVRLCNRHGAGEYRPLTHTTDEARYQTDSALEACALDNGRPCVTCVAEAAEREAGL